MRNTEPESEPEADVAASNATQPQETSLLQRIRNTWQFANLYQWIFIFGKVVKIDEGIDIEVLEEECLKHHSPVLVEIGLSLLKHVSSHRQLTPELFDEYTRRQYVAKDPEHNPFGTDETPARFHDFDIFTKLRILHRLTEWVMIHPERIREKMDVSDQTEWRIEPFGWDKDDRTYFLLDDDRLYRKTDAPPLPAASTWKPKKNTKKAKAKARAAKRRRTSASTAANADDGDDGQTSEHEATTAQPEDDSFGSAKWECIATNLAEIQAFLSTIQKTRDENEKVLRDRIEESLVPILSKHEESRKRKIWARQKELLNLEKMANAKRSSRLAGKAEQQKLEEQAREEEQRRRVEEAVAHKEEQKRLEVEKERDNRLMGRERRLKEREARRLAHEEELAQLSEDSKNMGSGASRLSQRRLQSEIDRNKKALQKLEDEDDDWMFDCVCGVSGQVDDGTHSIACEKCNVWQHSKCVNISEDEADRDDFHFICGTCQRKAAKPKTTIKLKVKNPGEPSSSPATAKSSESTPAQPQSESKRSGFVVEIPAFNPLGKPVTPVPPPVLNGLMGHSQSARQPIIPVKPSALKTPVFPPPSPYTNGEGPNPFSSPHPTLSPPQQSPNKSRAYSTIHQSSSPSSATKHTGEHKSLPPKGIFHVSPKVNGSLPPHADVTIPAVAARSDSPLKQPLDSASKTLPALSPPSISFHSGHPLGASATTTPSGLSTPQLKHGQPLAPVQQNGISPLKRSPPPAQQPSNGVHPTPAPAILPPVAALSPTPSRQIMTPPVKSVEPVRPPSQQSSGVAGGA